MASSVPWSDLAAGPSLRTGCRERGFSTALHILEKIRKFRLVTQWIEQWIGFEERQAWKPAVGRRPKPSVRQRPLIQLSVCGANAVGHMMIAVCALDDAIDQQAGGRRLALRGQDASHFGAPDPPAGLAANHRSRLRASWRFVGFLTAGP